MKNINLINRFSLPPIGKATQRGITHVVTCCLFLISSACCVQLSAQNADCKPDFSVDVSSGDVTVGTSGPGITLDAGGSTDFLYINSIGNTTVDLTCADYASSTVELTLISSTTADGSGVTDQCTVEIVIIDSTPPVANCVTSYGPVVVGAVVTTADLDMPAPGESFDACSGLTSLDITSSVIIVGAPDYTFTCADAAAGSVILTLTATDNAGLTHDCDVTITVTDGEAPVATCADFSYNLLDGPAIDLSLVTALSYTDNCTANVTESVSPNTVACPHNGTFTITYTVSDSNNSTNCTATVTVIDDEVPMITCNPDFTVSLDATGNISIVDGDVIASSSDNCAGSETVMLSMYDFACANIGTNTVTATATDANLNTATCTTVVTVQDGPATPPTCVGQNITRQLDATGNVSITAADVNNGSADNCTASVTATPLVFTCANVGPNTVTLTVSDGYNTAVTCTAIVTIEDMVAPDAQCQDASVILTGNPPSASITTADIDNGSTDACGILSLALDQTTFDCTDVSPVEITLTVTDVNGQVSDCTAEVTITQSTAGPTAACQNITIDLNTQTTITPAEVDNGSSGDCGFAYNNLTPDTFDCTDFNGTNPVVVTLVVTDNSGNTDACTAEVTITNPVVPVANCKDHTVILDASGNGSITTADIDDGSEVVGIFCGTLSLSADITTFDCTNVGTPVTVTLTATESNGPSSATCTSIVTILDDTAPIAVCQDFTADLNFGIANISPNDINNGSSDECNALTLLLSKTNFVCADGPTQTVTLTVVDASNNSDQCTAVVILEDNTPPNAICKDITVSLDNNGMYTAMASEFDDGSNDEELVNDPLRYMIDDNSASCPVSFVPVSGTSNSVALNGTFTTTNTYPIMDATSINSFEVFDGHTRSNLLGFLYFVSPAANVFVETADYSGTATGIFWEEVGDRLVVTWQDVGRQGAPINVAGEGVTFQYQIDRITGAIDFLYADTDYVVNDGCDDLACSYISVQRQGGGLPNEFNAFSNQTPQPGLTCLGYTPLQVGTMVDNCTAPGDLTFTFDSAQTTFDCSALPANAGAGTFTVTIDVSDEAGNSSQCTQTITIEDNEVPTVTCIPDVTVQLDATGSYTITEADVTSVFGDNCEIDFFTFSPQSTFTCGDIAASPIAVTVTATDESGKVSASCTSNVTVEDNMDPMLICKDLLDANGDGVQIGTTLNITAIIDNLSDNCGIATVSYDPLTDPIRDIEDVGCTVGSTTLTVYVADDNGNESTCSATVDIIDSTNPIINCNSSAITVVLDANGSAFVTPSQLASWSDDPTCGGNLAVDVNDPMLDCDDLFFDNGFVNLTVTVTDDGGNSNSCDALIRVDENNPVTSTCPPTSISNPIEYELDMTSLDLSFDANQIATDHGATISSICNNYDWAFINPHYQFATNDPCTNGSAAPGTQGMFNYSNGNPISGTFDCTSEGVTFSTVIAPYNQENGYQDEVVFDFNSPCFNVGVNSCRVYVKIVSAPPVAVCQDVTVNLDGTGNYTLAGSTIDGGSTDDCNIPFSFATPNTFDCSHAGTTEVVTLTVFDASGNTDTDDCNVTIIDNEAPVAICQDVTVELDADGIATAPVVADFEDSLNPSTDNCSIASTMISTLSDFDCDDVTGTDPPIDVTYTVTDASGLTDTEVCTVTIEDNMGPVLTCLVTEIALADYTEDPLNPGQYIVPKIDLMTCTDNCGISQAFIDGFFTLNCGNTNSSTVSFNFNSFVDVNGNPQDSPITCAIQVLGTAPVAECKDITVDLDTDGVASIVGTDVDDGSTDDCDNVDNPGGLAYSLDLDAFTCANITAVTGNTTPVTLTVTDGDDMTATCVSNVTVRDLIAPMPVCASNIEVQLSATDGTYTLMASELDDPTATIEICSYVVSIPPTVFDCSSGVTANVDLTATDPSGNDNTVSCVVNIINPAPKAQCVAPYEVELDNNGEATITLADINDGSFDFCEDALGAPSTLSYVITVDDADDDNTDITCDSGSSADVTLTVTDGSGNTDDCTVTVTIKDAPPVAMCSDVTVELDMAGNYTMAQAEIDALGAGTTDICGETAFTYSLSQTSFDCTEIGTDHYTLTVMDASGNSDNCIVSVTVEDNLAPDMNCVPNFTAVLDASGSYTGLTAADINAGSMDNCDGAVFTIELAPGSPTSFDCTNVGLTYPIQLNGTDSEGNLGICNSIITVERDDNFPCSCIQDFEVYNDNPLADGYRYANINVTSAGTVAANGDVHYKAGSSLDFLPGFEVLLGGEFLGDIGPCDPE